MDNEIRAVYTKKTVRVYQAYNDEIANEAVKKGTFGNCFKLDRMTWIKPSFLWMMYRCGWGSKENQERILAIDIDRSAFDYIVKNAVSSSYNIHMSINHSEWKEQLKTSDIRCQWDPERDIMGNPLNYRSIQLGLRGKAINMYVNEWIAGITDITDYVEDLSYKKNMGVDIQLLLPNEQIYIIDDHS